MDILMAFFDLVPVGLFLASAIILQRCFYNKMSKGAFAIFSAGTIFIFTAGFCKALYKILYYLNICDWAALKNPFFLMQTIGFVLAGVGLLAMMLYKQGDNKQYAFIPALALLTVSPKEFSGTMVFVVLMILGVALFDTILVITAVKMKKPLIVVLLVISFIFTLGMGYLSTKEDMSDWIKEFVNTIGQGTLFASVLLFKKNGLAETDSLKGITKY